MYEMKTDLATDVKLLIDNFNALMADVQSLVNRANEGLIEVRNVVAIASAFEERETAISPFPEITTESNPPAELLEPEEKKEERRPTRYAKGDHRPREEYMTEYMDLYIKDTLTEKEKRRIGNLKWRLKSWGFNPPDRPSPQKKTTEELQAEYDTLKALPEPTVEEKKRISYLGVALRARGIDIPCKRPGRSGRSVNLHHENKKDHNKRMEEYKEDHPGTEIKSPSGLFKVMIEDKPGHWKVDSFNLDKQAAEEVRQEIFEAGKKCYIEPMEKEA